MSKDHTIQIGQRLRILYMEGEPEYTRREGTVTRIDDAGQIHGTWGGLAIIPSKDRYEIVGYDTDGEEIYE